MNGRDSSFELEYIMCSLQGIALFLKAGDSDNTERQVWTVEEIENGDVYTNS